MLRSTLSRATKRLRDGLIIERNIIGIIGRDLRASEAFVEGARGEDAVTKTTATPVGVLRKNRVRAFSSVRWEQIESTRTESDLLGTMEIPSHALYGIATARAMENYDITGNRLSKYPELVRALALTKKACATANRRIGLLDNEVYEAITHACDALIESSEHHHHFTVDVIQGGAGTSTNMNANEVIANLAARKLGLPIGDYAVVNPNDHVNLCQSTNDAYPTAAKLAVVLRHSSLVDAVRGVITSLRAKGDEFEDVIKMGRTQLQDAVPMTLGQEFHSFAATLAADLTYLERNIDQMYEMNLGGTAIGTSICADTSFADEAVRALSELTGLPMRSPNDFIEASSSTSSFLLFSNILRRIAIKISKICNDLRLLSSGPRCGLNEINLPAVAPGSSIMPGKINPVIPEVMNQVCFQIIGTDASIAAASEAAQLQLNVFEPVIVYNLLNNMDMLERGLNTLRTKCIDGITANPEVCKRSVDNSIGIVTALLPLIGYKKSSAVAKEALATGRPVAEIAAQYAKPDEIAQLLRPQAMTRARKLEKRGVCLDTPAPLEAQAEGII
ncbi:Fumarate lyase [Ostreococcus tauri]|uniref:Aspartate ammonia-lyase n=1 Tax=Ostreococcus tauri TaxID=70448 RepID=Q00SM0_OSTTA|nr:Fumarate lyase [Ostreococcus tauri]OUS45124.1 aspartate ammonia-lyase [Ostreococcus tauri]CAL58594.1 Fumarate lyase [Ostreococcus tauri]|eukprot:XP_003084178.1 Fumarate lyase [Ostreococcus tauri]